MNPFTPCWQHSGYCISKAGSSGLLLSIARMGYVPPTPFCIMVVAPFSATVMAYVYCLYPLLCRRLTFAPGGD